MAESQNQYWLRSSGQLRYPPGAEQVTAWSHTEQTPFPTRVDLLTPSHLDCSRGVPAHDFPSAGRLYVKSPQVQNQGSGGAVRRRPRKPRKPPEPYNKTIGRNLRKFFPLRRSRHGKGLCIIIVNNQTDIPGVQKDIERLENHYESICFTVCGGRKDEDCENKRDLSLEDLDEIITKLNSQYDGKIAIRGTEYDRILIHFFALGDRDYMIMDNNERISKINILDKFNQNIPNLQGEVPVAVFLHSHHMQSLPHNVSCPISHTEPTGVSRNVIGVFSVNGHVADYNPEQLGSWIIKEYVDQLEAQSSRVHLTDILMQVNDRAQAVHHPAVTGIDGGFKELLFTMEDEFFHNC